MSKYTPIIIYENSTLICLLLRTIIWFSPDRNRYVISVNRVTGQAQYNGEEYSQNKHLQYTSCLNSLHYGIRLYRKQTFSEHDTLVDSLVDELLV